MANAKRLVVLSLALCSCSVTAPRYDLDYALCSYDWATGSEPQFWNQNSRLITQYSIRLEYERRSDEQE